MPAALPEPDLARALAALNAAGARYVVIGGFAVIANAHVRATEDVDLLVPDELDDARSLAAAAAALEGVVLPRGDAVSAERIGAADHLRLRTAAGLLDILKEGAPPLDYESVAADAHRIDYEGQPALIAGLASLVAFKRLSARPRDRQDLDALRELHGELPMLRVPGLDA